MNTKLFIADKIKVGFNPRTDTYSGRLAYIIGHDGKKWRKEKSWDDWRYKFIEPSEYEKLKLDYYNNYIDQQKRWFNTVKSDPKNYYYKSYGQMTEEQYLETLITYETYKPNIGRTSDDPKMKVEEYENVPTEGFVLNKKAGGYSSGWNHRNTYCRVYDPRGFEFEISIQNLLFILQECDSYKGKALEGSFVYSWDGKDLVLLPTSSLDYRESKKYTNLQSGKVSTKELVEGGIYKDKHMDDYIFIGKFPWIENNYRDVIVSKSFVFYCMSSNTLTSFSNMSSFVKVVDSNPVSNYVELLDMFNKSNNLFKRDCIKEVEYKPLRKIEYYRGDNQLGQSYLKLSDNEYEICDISMSNITKYGAYYYSSYNINSYDLKTNKLLILNGDSFSIKTIKEKVKNGLTYNDLENLKMISLKEKNDNKSIKFVK